MKRKGFLYEKMCSLENLQLADCNAQKGKRKQPGVMKHNQDQDMNILRLHHLLVDKTYRTSPYQFFKVFEPKERLVARLPYYPDRIVHHAIMNVLAPVLVPTFTRDTYSSLKGRGIHPMVRNLKKALQDVPGTKYCLKMDIRKFYPSINHNVLKYLIRRKLKDQDMLWLLDEIIDSAPGVPIGNYLSQYFANYYLSGLDHWLKEVKGVKYYFRYADDLVILAGTKEELHQLLAEVKAYVSDKLKLNIKQNYQVFPVSGRGIDVIGYKFYHTHTLLRKKIKKAFARKLKKKNKQSSTPSYLGWAKHCDSKHLIKKLLNDAA